MRQQRNPIKKKLTQALIAASVVTFICAVLLSFNIIRLDCTVRYLNPWQHVALCSLVRLAQYLLLFLVSFLASFSILLLKKTQTRD